MKNPEIEFDHIGIAVESHTKVYSFWKSLGWDEDQNPETVVSQKVKVAMLPLKNQANVELLEPTDGGSPVQKFINKRGPGIHHVCFRVKNIDGLLEKLKSEGVSEDEIKTGEAEVQKLTDGYIVKVDQLAEAKEKDIMTV